MSENQQPGEPVAWDRERILIILSEVVARWSMAGDDYRGRQEAYAWGVNALTLPHPRPRVGVTEAMVEAFLAAYAKCELYNGWTFTHRMGVRAGIRAALADSPAPPANGGGEVARG